VENFDKDVYEDIRISYPEFWREIEQARNDRLHYAWKKFLTTRWRQGSSGR
jgi:hypothetical protein